MDKDTEVLTNMTPEKFAALQLHTSIKTLAAMETLISLGAEIFAHIRGQDGKQMLDFYLNDYYQRQISITRDLGSSAVKAPPDVSDIGEQ